MSVDAVEKEHRFAHLLKPIRNLTHNWNVDIATELQEYLDDIEEIEFTFDQGLTKLNFAEAALLIQGSACIYSKKVEYLYALVYQVLDLLAVKRTQSHVSSLHGTADADTDFAETSLDFLSLDDLPVASNIDLKEERYTRAEWEDGGDTGRLDRSSVEIDLNTTMGGATPAFRRKTRSMTAELARAATIVSRIPLSLLPLDKAEKSNIPFINHRGDHLGDLSDFRVNTGVVNKQGAIVFDEGYLSKQDATGAPMTPHREPGAAHTGPEVTTLAHMDTATSSDAMHMDTTDHGVAFDCDEQNEPADDFLDDEGADVDDEGPAAAASHGAGSGTGRDEAGTRASVRFEDANEATSLPCQDPWDPLDPHDEGPSSMKRPLRKGRTYRVPKHLVAGKSNANATACSTTPTSTITDFCGNMVGGNVRGLPRDKMKAPLREEFSYLFWPEVRRRKEAAKKYRLGRLEAEQHGTVRRLEEGPREEPLDDDAGPIFGGDYEPMDGDDDDDDDGDGNEFAGEYQVDSMVELGNVAVAGEAGVAASYEDLVKAHVDKFIDSAKIYAHETALSSRVRVWEERLLPVLEVQEDRVAFNIEEYGRNIMDKLHAVTSQKGIDQPRAFGDVTSANEAFEVCRMFLATLQLANNGNVEIVQGQGDNSLKVKLLTRNTLESNISAYKAPSTATGDLSRDVKKRRTA